MTQLDLYIGSLQLRSELCSKSLFGTNNNIDRVSATQVVHFAHESTSTYLTHIEVELYGTFFYNQFSSRNNNSF